MKILFRIYISLLFIGFLYACSSTKYVPNGQYLLDKVEIISNNKNIKSSDLKPYLRQQPNFKMFGLIKTQLYVYDWSGRDSTRWLSKQLRRMGEPPVILDTMLVTQSETELQRYLVNKGYMQAQVSSRLDTARKKATVIYDVVSNAPYRIHTYQMNLDDPAIDSIARLSAPRRSRVAAIFGEPQELYTPLVRQGNLFDRDVLDKERQRITTLLRRRGYYAFNKDYLVYQADSSFRKNIVDLEMLLKPFLKALPDGGTEELPHRKYYIKDVTIVTDYDPLNNENNTPVFRRTDSVRYDGTSILYGENGKSIRPSVLGRSSFIRPGKAYNEKSVEQTYSAFSSLAALRNVNVRFNEIVENDSLKLNCFILTSPAKLQTFGIDLEGTNTAGDLGFATAFSYRHRNLFHGSEVFGLKLRGAYEGLGGKIFSQNFFEFGVESSLSFPRFLFPFLTSDFRRKIRASTELKVSYNMQSRPEYNRRILSGGWNYVWQGRSNNTERHTVKLLDIDYVYLPRIDQQFRDSLPESTALYNYTNQFIVGTGYTYAFSNYNPQNKMRNTSSLRASLELAGNVLYGISKLTDARRDSLGNYSLFGINYSQFIKADVDFSKTFVLDQRNTLAFHVGAGMGFPYGNADILPFERRYFAGGANSVRGWSVRSLGPGSMPKTDSTSFYTQAGDIRLDLNIEYRTRLFWKFQLAAYIDAGNIWTIKPYNFQPDGEFRFDQFYKQIAFSYGLGLRLDFDFFLIRFDTGMKAYNPQERGRKRWALLEPGNFKDNFAWHFAVGYPF